jgi:hypothetical protein
MMIKQPEIVLRTPVIMSDTQLPYIKLYIHFQEKLCIGDYSNYPFYILVMCLSNFRSKQMQ